MKILNNGIAIIERDTHISRWVEQHERLDHDQNMLPIVGKYINEGDTVLDIGAYIGDHTIFYSKKVGPSGSVIAFEPNPEAFECLYHNMYQLSNVWCMEYGCSDSPGFAGINSTCENVGMASLTNNGAIKLMTIDSLDLKECHFIKIDVEGFEIKVLRGATKTIKRYKPRLLIEINDHTLKAHHETREAIFDFLAENGYKYENIYKGQKLNDPQLDIICY